MLRENVAAGIVNPVKVDTLYNIADFLTKSLEWKAHHRHTGAFFAGGWNLGEAADMSKASLVGKWC